MRLLKSMIAFAFGPFLAWINSILDPFKNAGMNHPHWANEANNLAGGFAAVLTLTLVALLSRMGEKAGRVILIALVLLLAVLTVAIFWVKEILGDQLEQQAIETWIEIWRRVYIPWLVVVALAAVTALHYILRSDE